MWTREWQRKRRGVLPSTRQSKNVPLDHFIKGSSTSYSLQCLSRCHNLGSHHWAWKGPDCAWFMEVLPTQVNPLRHPPTPHLLRAACHNIPIGSTLIHLVSKPPSFSVELLSCLMGYFPLQMCKSAKQPCAFNQLVMCHVSLHLKPKWRTLSSQITTCQSSSCLYPLPTFAR